MSSRVAAVILVALPPLAGESVIRALAAAGQMLGA
jgi:hypothetical protein